MRSPVLSSVILSIAGCLSCMAQPAPVAGLAESLIAQSRAVPTAEQAKDSGRLEQLLTDDFRQVGSEGRVHSKREFVDDAKEGNLTDFTLYNFKVLPLDDNAAIVTFDAVIHQPEGDGDLAPRYQHISDVWVKQGDQWRLRFEQSTARRPID